MGMSGHVSAGPLRTCVKVEDYLIRFLPSIETCVESDFATDACDLQ
jgi:hypothetical protein